MKQLISKIQEHLENAGDNNSNFSEAVTEIFTQEIVDIFINSGDNNKSN